jgi:hypothetical protein
VDRSGRVGRPRRASCAFTRTTAQPSTCDDRMVASSDGNALGPSAAGLSKSVLEAAGAMHRRRLKRRQYQSTSNLYQTDESTPARDSLGA